MTAGQPPTDRLRYAPEHWAREEDPGRALALYLEACARPFNHTKATIIARMLPGDLTGSRVLDFGCGGGLYTVLCAERGARVTAVDAEAAALATAARHAASRGLADRCEFVQADRFSPALAARRFDLVIAKDVIEHVPDDQGLLDALGRSQEAGGLLLVSTQNACSLTFVAEGLYYRSFRGQRDWCGWDPTHLRFYTPRSLSRRLRAAGYRPLRRHGVYVVPWRILTYLLLFRRWIELPALRYVDLWLGGRFPLNCFGWDIMVTARKVAGP